MSSSEAVKLVIERTFACSPETLFDMWTLPEHLENWWAPEGFTTEVLAHNLQPGGRFHYQQVNAEGQGQIGLFIYDEVDRPHRLVFRSGFADTAGEFIQAPFHPDFPRVLHNIVIIEPHEQGALLTTEGMPFNGSEAENVFFLSMHENMKQGFSGTYDHLDRYLADL